MNNPLSNVEPASLKARRGKVLDYVSKMTWNRDRTVQAQNKTAHMLFELGSLSRRISAGHEVLININRTNDRRPSNSDGLPSFTPSYFFTIEQTRKDTCCKHKTSFVESEASGTSMIAVRLVPVRKEINTSHNSTIGFSHLGQSSQL